MSGKFALIIANTEYTNSGLGMRAGEPHADGLDDSLTDEVIVPEYFWQKNVIR